MMIYRYRSMPLFVALLLLLAGCQIGAAPLSQQQLQDFVRDKKIQPLAVANPEGQLTAILFKDTHTVGCYTVWAGNGIEAQLMTTANISSQQDIVARPAIAIYNPVFGIDIFCMTITDPNIRQQAQTVKVVFQDGQEMTVPIQNQGDMVISRKSDKENPHVDAIFYDSNQKELLKVLFWGGTETRVK
jgi:hypothetical protein